MLRLLRKYVRHIFEIGQTYFKIQGTYFREGRTLFLFLTTTCMKRCITFLLRKNTFDFHSYNGNQIKRLVKNDPHNF